VTLQKRVLGYLALIAVISCALTMLTAIVLLRERAAAQRLSALQAQASGLAVVGVAREAVGPGSYVYRVIAGRPRRVRPRIREAVLRAVPPGDGHGTIAVAGRSLLYVAQRTPVGRIVLFTGAALPFADWRPVLVSVLLAGLGGVLLAVLFSYPLARRLTRPIAALASATGRLARGETGVSVATQGEDELAHLGRAFNQMSIQLAHARTTQRRFLESVSHELKTPLTSIRGYAEGIQEAAVAPAQAAKVITAEARRLERLVVDLLDLARIGRDGFTVRREPVELGALASTALERHLPHARELGVELQHTGATQAWAIGDEQRLLQVVANLIENALRLTPPGGSVTLHTAPGRLAISDTGPGLAAEDLPHVFDRFYLHDRYRSQRPVGSGLGLAIVKELTEAMGGTVHASSDGAGAGATFTITLPDHPAPTEPPSPKQTSAAISG
jgi:two-component system OmpR family sensor kinase